MATCRAKLRAADCTGTASISVASVTALLKSLKAKVGERKDWVNMALSANSPQYMTMSRKLDELTNEVDSVGNELKEIWAALVSNESSADGDSVRLKLGREIETFEHSKQTILVLSEAVEVLRTLTKIRQGFDSFDDAIKNVTLDTAADVICQVQLLEQDVSSSLRGADAAENLKQLDIVEMINEGLNSRRSSLVVALHDVINTLLTFQPHLIEITKTRQVDNKREGYVSLEHVWHAMMRLKTLKGTMSQIVKKIGTNILTPLFDSVVCLRSGKTFLPFETYDAERRSVCWTWTEVDDSTDTTLTSSHSESGQDGTMNFRGNSSPAVTCHYTILLRILESFLRTVDVQLFQSAHDIMDIFGRIFWPLVGQKICSTLGSPNSQEIDKLKKFETNMVALQLIPTDQKNILTKFASQKFESDFSQRKAAILSKIRHLLISIPSVTTTVRVSDSNERAKRQKILAAARGQHTDTKNAVSSDSSNADQFGRVNSSGAPAQDGVGKSLESLSSVMLSSSRPKGVIKSVKSVDSSVEGSTLEDNLQSSFHDVASLISPANVFSEYLSDNYYPSSFSACVSSTTNPTVDALSRDGELREREGVHTSGNNVFGLTDSKNKLKEVMKLLNIDKDTSNKEFCARHEASYLKDVTTSQNPSMSATSSESEVNDVCGGMLYYSSLPACSVSVAVHTLVDSIYTLTKDFQYLVTLQQTVKGEYEEGHQFIRDLVSLFLALRPTTHKHRLATDLSYGPIVFTDCLYLSFHLSLLSFANNSDNPTKQRKPQTGANDMPRCYLDFIISLNALGRSTLLSTMSNQTKGLTFSLGISLRQMSQDRHYAHVETILSGAVQHLKMLSSSWIGILPKNIYISALGLLMDLFLRSLLEQIFQLKNVRPSDAAALRHVLLSMDGQLESLLEYHFQQNLDISESADGNELSCLNDSLKDYVTAWKAFKLIVRLLGGDLSQYVGERVAIGQCFEKDQLRALLGLTPELGCSVAEAVKEISRPHVY